MTTDYDVPLSKLLGSYWPVDVFPLPGPLEDVIGTIGIEACDARLPAGLTLRLVVRAPIVVAVPGLEGFALSLGAGTGVVVDADLIDPFRVTISGLAIALRLDPDLLRPMRRADGRFEPDPGRPEGAEVAIEGTVGFTGDGGLILEPGLDFALTPVMLGESGVVFEATGVRLLLAGSEASPDESASERRGIHIERAAVHLPPDLEVDLPSDFAFEDCTIGSGGFSGAISASWDPPLAASLGGINCRLQGIDLTLEQNAFVECSLRGQLFVPWFEQWVGVELSLDAGGGLALSLTGELLELSRPNLLKITVRSIALEKRDGDVTFTVAGTLRPELGGLDWPSFEVDGLSIRSDGTIDLQGGWIDLGAAETLDFHGFRIDVTRIGFGTNAEGGVNTHWLAVSGEITLADGVPIAGSVEGLTFRWDPAHPTDVDVSLDGVAVTFEIPGTLALEGSVSYSNEGDVERGLAGELFKGSVRVRLLPLDVDVDADLLIGHVTDNATGEDFAVLFVVLNADFPTPIPLAASGIALYGIGGLVGLNLTPDRHITDGIPEPWYEWYKATRGSARPYTVAHVDKWAAEPGHTALGASCDLGTVSDNGTALNARALVALLLPGPVILIEGSANFLRSRGDRAEGSFHALGVMDGQAGTLQLNVDLHWDLERVVAVSGGMEAFFDLTNPGRWHLHLGAREPQTKRISASVLALFAADSYLMVDQTGVVTGATIGFDWHASLGPVTLAVVARLAFDASIFWKPVHLEGRLQLVGAISLKVFGFGLGLLIETLLEGRAPTPYRVHGMARVALDLPWPLPEIDIDVELTWEDPPARPSPVNPFLREARAMHHKLTGATWQLAGDEATAPVVPTDSRAVLMFARPIAGLSSTRDTAGATVPAGPDVVGDARFEYRLVDSPGNRLQLAAKQPGGMWTPVREGLAGPAGTVATFELDERSLLPASDAQEPQLELWRTAPLDLTARGWLEAFADVWPPCGVRREAPTHCVDWSTVPDGTSWPHEFRHEGLSFVATVLPPTAGWASPIVHAGTLHSSTLLIGFAEAASTVEVMIADYQGSAVRLSAFRRGDLVAEEVTPAPVAGIWTGAFDGLGEIDAIQLQPVGIRDRAAILLRSVCYRTARDVRLEDATTSPALPDGDGADETGSLLLRPNTDYRLTLATATRVDDEAPEMSPRSFYFHTGDGPGLAPADAPFAGGPLDALATYVARTCPADGSQRFYHGHDLAVEFNESYVAGLYAHDLALTVKDRSGRTTGEPAAAWGSTSPPILTAGLAWAAAKAAADCADEVTSPRTPRLHRPAPDALLPQRLYVVQVVSHGVPLYEFRFRSSRFGDASQHLSSGVVGGEQVVRTLAEVLPPDHTWAPEHRGALDELVRARARFESAAAAGDLLLLHDAVNAVATARIRLDRISDSAFHALDDAAHARFAEIGLGSRPLPPQVELLSFPISGKSTHLLLLESPEPIEWHRITCVLVDALGTVECGAVWNHDQTRAFLVRRDDQWWAAGRHELALTFSGAAIGDLPLLTRRGLPVAERVRLPFRLG